MRPVHRFAQNLKEVRDGLDLTQEQVGDACDLHRTEISLLERAGREPRLETIAKLARGLQVPVARLFDGIVE
jgi:transcriptional regulator with XRE-family HTH domain